MREIKIGGEYEHFKGGHYRALMLVNHHETQEPWVVYEELYGDHKKCVRPLEMFLEEVTRDGVTKPRFRLID